MSKFRILIAKFTLFLLFGELSLLGLFAYKVDYKTRQAGVSSIKLIHSLVMGLGCITIYVFASNKLITNPALEYFSGGIAYYTITCTNVIAFCLIVTFYGVQIICRKTFIAFLNRIHENFQSFDLFYGNVLSFYTLDVKTLRNLQEINHVYVPLFWKCFVVHFSILAMQISIAYYVDDIFTNASGFITLSLYQCLPYAIQSTTSSYLYLGALKMSFLYVEMEKKLDEIRHEVLILAQCTQRTRFEKMKRFCEFSEQVDSMSKSFLRINKMGMDLGDLYRIHMVFILGYSVFHSLTLLFLQYLGAAYQTRGLLAFDYRLGVAALGFVLLNVFEIILIVNSVQESEALSRKVVRRSHSINYWQSHFDVRLKRSLETFAHIAAGDRLDITLFKMRKLNSRLILGIFDSVMSYLIIMIQFDLANQRRIDTQSG